MLLRYQHLFLGTLATIATLTGCTPSTPEISIVPPDAVQQAFTKQYPGITPTWQQKSYGYEAVFMQNGLETEVEYNAAGQWLETEVEVEEAAFSKAVLDRVRREYPEYTITKREIETTPNGTFYEVEIIKGKQDLELYFNDRAQLVTNTNEDT